MEELITDGREIQSELDPVLNISFGSEAESFTKAEEPAKVDKGASVEDARRGPWSPRGFGGGCPAARGAPVVSWRLRRRELLSMCSAPGAAQI